MTSDNFAMPFAAALSSFLMPGTFAPETADSRGTGNLQRAQEDSREQGDSWQQRLGQRGPASLNPKPETRNPNLKP